MVEISRIQGKIIGFPEKTINENKLHDKTNSISNIAIRARFLYKSTNVFGFSKIQRHTPLLQPAIATQLYWALQKPVEWLFPSDNLSKRVAIWSFSTINDHVLTVLEVRTYLWIKNLLGLVWEGILGIRPGRAHRLILLVSCMWFNVHLVIRYPKRVFVKLYFLDPH